MITHVALMTPRLDLSSADRDALIAAFLRALREIPGVQQVRVGRRVRHGTGYEQAVPLAGDYFVSIDFADLPALQAYLGHPGHDDLGRRFGASLAEAAVYDFEVGGLEMFDRWRPEWKA